MLGILVLLASLALLAWGVWPVGRSTRQADLRLPSGGVYNLELAWPSWMRLGDPDVIRLELKVGDGSIPVPGEHNRLVEGRLEASGLMVVPAGEVLEPLRPGRQVVFFWSVLPAQPGELEAVAWVNLYSQAGANLELDGQLLTAQKIPIRTFALLGLDGRQARFIGDLGILLGMLLCLEGFFSLRKRYRKKP